MSDIEVFRVSEMDAAYNMEMDHASIHTVVTPGWYWWDDDPDVPPVGPFLNEESAREDADGPDDFRGCAATSFLNRVRLGQSLEGYPECGRQVSPT